MSAKRGTFQHLVYADSADEAVEIASEACPKGAEVTSTEVIDAAAECGPHSWLVTIKFKRAEPEGEI